MRVTERRNKHAGKHFHMNGLAQKIILTSRQRKLRKGLPVLNLLLLIVSTLDIRRGTGLPYKKDEGAHFIFNLNGQHVQNCH